MCELNIFSSKIDICVKFWLPKKYHKISRLRIFLVVRLRFGAYIEQTQPLQELQSKLPEEN